MPYALRSKGPPAPPGADPTPAQPAPASQEGRREDNSPNEIKPTLNGLFGGLPSELIRLVSRSLEGTGAGAADSDASRAGRHRREPRVSRPPKLVASQQLLLSLPARQKEDEMALGGGARQGVARVLLQPLHSQGQRGQDGPPHPGHQLLCASRCSCHSCTGKLISGSPCSGADLPTSRRFSTAPTSCASAPIASRSGASQPSLSSHVAISLTSTWCHEGSRCVRPGALTPTCTL